MSSTISMRLVIAMALLLAAMSTFAPAAPAVRQQNHPQAAHIKNDPWLARGHDGPVERTTVLVHRTDGSDGYQPQLRAPTSSPTALVRVDGPDGWQPQLRGYQPVVLTPPDDGIDWVAGSSGLGIGLALSLLFAGAWIVARRSRLAHS